jgi:hypothetical protein
MVRSSQDARPAGVVMLVGDPEQVEMAKEARKEQEPEDEPKKGESAKACTVCGTKLSSYNPGPNCWQHTIGYPWRGPSAKPRYD